MKKVIYYFSGTGNNYYVAKTLSDKLQDTDFFPVTKLINNKIIDSTYDIIGFTVPSYYSHVPTIIKQCLNCVKFTSSQKIFSIITSGGNPGSSVNDMRYILNKCDKEILQEFNLILPGNFILSYGAFPKIYDNLLYKLSEKKLTSIAEIILDGTEHKISPVSFFYKLNNTEKIKYKINSIPLKGKLFKVNSDCIRCGRCAKLCPVDNIKVINNEVIFGDKCELCMACIQWCPQEAIYYLDKTPNRKRYHHPKVSASDLIYKLRYE